MAYLIGIDIGTQGTKAGLFDLSGNCLAQAFRPSKLIHPEPGAVEEDPERQVASVCQAIRACVEEADIQASDVVGIGLDGQMAGVIGVGEDGRNVTPYDSWLDGRCASYVRKMAEEAGEEVTRKSGCAPSINHGPKKLWWMHERKKEYRSIRAFVQPGGYAAMRLCGLDGSQAFIDTTYLHFSGFADNAQAVWDEDLCGRFGLDMEKLPRIVEPQEVVGSLTGRAARRCGLKAGVPLVAGCGDTAASFLACGAVSEGISVDVAGTASVFASTTSTFRPDLEHRTLGCGRSATPGLWHPYGYINGGGMNLEWFRREIADRGASAGLDFDALNRAAEKALDHGVAPLFVPHLGGRVSPSQPELRGAWVDLNWDHGLGDLYCAVLEGVALEYALYKKVLLELQPDLRLRELRITGGGEKSAVWNRIKADVLQLPVRRVNRSEGAPLGAALLAGYGVGAIRNLASAARQWIGLGERIAPSRKRSGYYAQRLDRYTELLGALDPGTPGPSVG